MLISVEFYSWLSVHYSISYICIYRRTEQKSGLDKVAGELKADIALFTLAGYVIPGLFLAYYSYCSRQVWLNFVVSNVTTCYDARDRTRPFRWPRSWGVIRGRELENNENKDDGKFCSVIWLVFRQQTLTKTVLDVQIYPPTLPKLARSSFCLTWSNNFPIFPYLFRFALNLALNHPRTFPKITFQLCHFWSNLLPVLSRFSNLVLKLVRSSLDLALCTF